MSTTGVLVSTLHVLMHLSWTQTRLGTLGVPKVTLGVAGPDANPKLWLLHYKRNDKALSPATILESETIREHFLRPKLVCECFELKVPLCVSEVEGEVLVAARVWSSSMDLSSSEGGASLRGKKLRTFLFILVWCCIVHF